MTVTTYTPEFRIYKYPLAVTDVQTVELPENATVLSVQAQGNELVFWARVDIKAQIKPRVFRVIGTGHPIPDAAYLNYVDTVVLEARAGSLIWHVFESFETQVKA
jgi:hypothetical protein